MLLLLPSFVYFFFIVVDGLNPRMRIRSSIFPEFKTFGAGKIFVEDFVRSISEINDEREKENLVSFNSSSGDWQDL